MKSHSHSAARFLVRGRVQGVGFRYYAQAAATRLKVRGWVRNREDGAVEALAIAPPQALEKFVAALRQGPPGARVDSVESQPVEAVDEARHTGFRVEI